MTATTATAVTVLHVPTLTNAMILHSARVTPTPAVSTTTDDSVLPVTLSAKVAVSHVSTSRNVQFRFFEKSCRTIATAMPAASTQTASTHADLTTNRREIN